MNTKTLVLIAALAVAGCTHARDVSQPLTVTDKGAEFTVKDTPGGFSVEVKYSRYQFAPNPTDLLAECRALVTARVREDAKTRGREIEPLNEQAIRTSAGRNMFLGRSSCSGFTEATWKK
jgi:hypothetical protein